MKKYKFINCKQCNSVMKDPGMLHYKNGFPCLVCKSCIYKEIYYNINNEEIIKKWCKEFDIPFIKEEWNFVVKIQKEYDFSKELFPYMHFRPFGKYLAKMKLPDWINYTYEDGIEINKRWGK